jgi:outer membrane protein TolC
VDLFRRLSHNTEAARRDAQAERLAARVRGSLVQASAAQTYLALRTLDAERACCKTR